MNEITASKIKVFTWWSNIIVFMGFGEWRKEKRATQGVSNSIKSFLARKQFFDL